MTVWILTEAFNLYDQMGDYFVAVFAEKPHHSQLTKHEVPKNRLRHVLDGGGRKDMEEHWFYLKEEEV